MNERIKELAEQAGIPVIEGHWDYNDREILVKNDGEWRKALPSEIIHTMFQSEKGLEKFAELLIKECVQVIQDQSYYTSDAKVAGLDIAKEVIQKHFGVEE